MLLKEVSLAPKLAQLAERMLRLRQGKDVEIGTSIISPSGKTGTCVVWIENKSWMNTTRMYGYDAQVVTDLTTEETGNEYY